MTIRYRVAGSVRGLISSNHRTLSGAVRSLVRDQNSCRRLPGGMCYSDACVEREDGEPLTDAEEAEVYRLHGEMTEASR